MVVKPLAGLTKALCILLKIDIAITAVALYVGFYYYKIYANLPASVDPNMIFLPSDAANAIIGLIQTTLFIILGITFLMWIYRTNKNLHVLSGEKMIFTPGWSVGWYFIPIFNLFKPYQAMKEIWQVSHKKETTHGILGWWWFLWIVSGFLGRIAFNLSWRAESVEDYTKSAIAYMASDGIDIILSIVALILVTHIGRSYSNNYVEQNTSPYEDSATIHPPQ